MNQQTQLTDSVPRVKFVEPEAQTEPVKPTVEPSPRLVVASPREQIVQPKPKQIVQPKPILKPSKNIEVPSDSIAARVKAKCDQMAPTNPIPEESIAERVAR